MVHDFLNKAFQGARVHQKCLRGARISNSFSPESIRLKLSDNERSYLITHISNLDELLPGNEFIRDEK